MSIIPALVAIEMMRKRREEEEEQVQRRRKQEDEAKRCPHCKQYLAVQTSSNTCDSTIMQGFNTTNSRML